MLFGTDAFGAWDVYALLGVNTALDALGIALTAMMRDGAVTRERAQRLAMMVLGTNASELYGLHLE